MITGDITQIDLARGQKSGLIEASRVLGDVRGIAFTRFTSADVVRHPTFKQEEIDRLKKDQLRNLAIQKSQPQSIALEQFRKTLYPNHPYGRLFPTEQMVQGYTIEDVQKFYKENFGAARTHVYVAGKFDAPAIKKAISDAFSSWQHGPDPLIDIPKPVTKRELELVDRPGAVQSTLYIGLPTIDPSNDDYIPLQVMNAILGGSFGSRITSNIAGKILITSMRIGSLGGDLSRRRPSRRESRRCYGRPR